MGSSDGSLEPAACAAELGSKGVQGHAHYMGGKPALYTGKYAFMADDMYKNATLAPFTKEVGTGLPPSRIALLTDGLCGSTCAIFLKIFQENKLARLVSVGGLAYQ